MALISRRDKGPKEAMQVPSPQELLTYSQYLDEVASRVKRSEGLIGTMLFRASGGIRKATNALLIACEQDYEQVMRVLFTEVRGTETSVELPLDTKAKHSTDSQDELTEAHKQGVYPEIAQAKDALLRLNCIVLCSKCPPQFLSRLKPLNSTLPSSLVPLPVRSTKPSK